MIQSEEEVLSIYNQLKSNNNGLPLKYREFIKASGVNKRALVKIFGSDAYTKLQKLAGDVPYKLNLEKAPIEKIMKAYGDLASEIIDSENQLPSYAHWAGKDLRPTESGLSKVHNIKWSEFPKKFYDYCEEKKSLTDQYQRLLNFIESLGMIERSNKVQSSQQKLYEFVCSELLSWSPALRRNREEAYKSELSNFLKQVKELHKDGHDVREEKGDSRCDIAIGSKIGIEIKKSPLLSEYDRCFGQIARHLKSYESVIVLIFDVPRQDQFEDFTQLVDRYYKNYVRVIKNC